MRVCFPYGTLFSDTKYTYTHTHTHTHVYLCMYVYNTIFCNTKFVCARVYSAKLITRRQTYDTGRERRACMS
jgi:hypothetical protein